jgi:hypothetical protein
VQGGWGEWHDRDRRFVENLRLHRPDNQVGVAQSRFSLWEGGDAEIVLKLGRCVSKGFNNRYLRGL